MCVNERAPELTFGSAIHDGAIGERRERERESERESRDSRRLIHIGAQSFGEERRDYFIEAGDCPSVRLFEAG